ncbi:MAG: C10 family peptidase [Paramuribaculum sp.]|nr:C10 family peptidase [Paramuribaculum sp.]
MKIKISVSLLLGLFVAFGSHAVRLSPSQALQRALLSIESSATTFATATESPRLVYTIESNNAPTLYVYSFGSDGFVILPSSDLVVSPVLGYADGAFDPDSIPDNLKWWLGQYSAEISLLEDRVVTPAGNAEPVAIEQRAGIEPLLSTLWNQDDPYNLLCPVEGTTRCPVGCVASAMAQVMKKWNHPQTGTGSKTYFSSTAGKDLTVDFSATAFDWQNMTDSYGESSSEASRNAVATLMYSCAVAVEMRFTPTASFSNYTMAATALVRYFGYDKSLRNLSRNYFELADWMTLIYDELEAGRPVLYGGSNDEGGHAFVCDGYRSDGYFHINWGWGGYSDGYFLLTALNPVDQGIGGSVGGYNLNQYVLVGIQPAAEDSEYIPVLEFMSDFTVGADRYDRLDGVEVTFSDPEKIYNMSTDEIEIYPGVALTDENGNVSYIEADSSVIMPKGGSIRSYSISADRFPSSGKYAVTPAVRLADSKNWYAAHVRMTDVRQYDLTATPGALRFSGVAEAAVTQDSLTLLSPVHPARTCGITAVLTNSGEEEYYRTVTPVLWRGDVEVAQADGIAVDLEGGMTRRFEWIGSFPSYLSAGTYTLVLVDNTGHRLGDGITVNVTDVLSATDEVSVPSVRICGAEAVGSTETTPILADLKNFIVDMTVRCDKGYIGEIVNGAVWFSETEGTTGLGGRFIGLDPGSQTTITVTNDLAGQLDPQHVYLLYVKCEVS